MISNRKQVIQVAVAVGFVITRNKTKKAVREKTKSEYVCGDESLNFSLDVHAVQQNSG